MEWIILIGFIVVIGGYLIGTYNAFVITKTRIEEALSGIDVQLKRRADLIPNVVETVKGYAKHESQVFENVTKARSTMLSAGSTKEKVEADNMLSDTLKSLFAVAEAYPQLKADKNFQELQAQLQDTEDKVAYSRQFYNSNVLDYNAKVRMFPSNLVASLFGFKEYDFFEAEDEAKKSINIKF